MRQRRELPADIDLSQVTVTAADIVGAPIELERGVHVRDRDHDGLGTFVSGVGAELRRRGRAMLLNPGPRQTMFAVLAKASRRRLVWAGPKMDVERFFREVVRDHANLIEATWALCGDLDEAVLLDDPRVPAPDAPRVPALTWAVVGVEPGATFAKFGTVERRGQGVRVITSTSGLEGACSGYLDVLADRPGFRSPTEHLR